MQLRFITRECSSGTGRQSLMNSSIIIRGAAVLVSLMLFSSLAFAETPNISKEKTGAAKISERVSLELYGGYLKGQSKEYVYDPRTGYMESELTWKIDEALVVGGTLNVRPFDWLTLRLGGWTPCKSQNKMDDYDWQVSGQGDWSDWSTHSNTKLNRAYMIDAGLEARVASFGATPVFDKASVSVLAGFRWFNVNWTAYGGSYIYSSNPGFRDVTGTDPDDEPGIDYEQWMETPYLGIGGTMSKGRWLIKAEVTGSFWGRARDKDNHFNRTLIFEEYYQNTAMLAGEVSLSYALTADVDLFGRFAYIKYYEAQAPTSMTNYSNGTTSYASGNAAGMEHQSLLFNLGIIWRIF
jgi:outer membrane protease